MDLIKKIVNIVNPQYEVDKCDFFSNYLQEEDSEYLQKFVSILGLELVYPSTILVVGSSVFPQKYFDTLRSLDKQFPEENINYSYNDIDLLVVPENAISKSELKTDINRVLKKLKINCEAIKTKSGISYGLRQNNTLHRYSKSNNHASSIGIKRETGTNIELILENDSNSKKTAADQILKERKNNQSFSILYKRV